MRRSRATGPDRVAAVVAVLGLWSMAAAGCEDIEPVVEGVEDVLPSTSTPRERYARMLERSGLDESALIRDWRASAVAAVERPLSVPTAYRAVVAIDPSGTAHAWRVPVRRGQRVRVRLTPGSPVVYLDAFAVRADGPSADPDVASNVDPARDDASPSLDLDALAHAGSGAAELDLLPERDGAIVVRAQPELLREGRYTIEIHVEPSLTFPVAGRGVPDIGSVFGDSREGGVRRHHGIDIFAPRGTPVVAGAAGRVREVETTPVGGRVVWMRTSEPRRSLYYAHLDSQIVRRGAQVDQGDTLGFVGNTGNARTTPPHLHFGIYSRGPVDPMAFVRPVSSRLPDLPPDSTFPGRWIRTARAGVQIRSSPDARSAQEAVPSGTAMRVSGANADWLSIALPDGRVGFLRAEGVEFADEPLRRIDLTRPSVLWASPGPDARPIMTLEPAPDLAVHGRFGDYLWVRASGGPIGWIEATE